MSEKIEIYQNRLELAKKKISELKSQEEEIKTSKNKDSKLRYKRRMQEATKNLDDINAKLNELLPKPKEVQEPKPISKKKTGDK